ncbi:serine protease [Acrocarpospora pleiomorpha]|uniref:Serine protease n=1 Tax=Acrocarpospora pleiomorpha TaxID=90975 RepID=A0A5M3XW04_9ACTN|nr:CAP family protein [Acrocarpospora pleiomorpha]GES25096.1 serine protease [Acrocarpospora pleiomorpha]
MRFVVTAALLTVGLIPAIAQASVEPLPGLKDQALDAVNASRAKYGARPLTWNDALYPDAERWALGCRFQHSDAHGRYGQNLYATSGATSASAAITDAFKSWMAEASRYGYHHPGFSRATGSFTQVVWKSTTQLAVAVAQCPGGTIFPSVSYFVVARFSPPGNFAGQFPQNVGRPVA